MKMNCPICGAGSVVHETRDLPYTYKGQTTTIHDIEGDYCDACGEAVFARQAGDRYGAAIQAFIKKVNASAGAPEFIRAVRKKLDLDQRQAGALFGGGDNAFSRYETGKTTPPTSLVKLLSLLDRHPELLNEIRGSDNVYALSA
jgi:HTH-type transcriptional regulator/antitoxin MqsA